MQLSIDPAGEPTIVYKSSPCQMVAMFCDSSSTDTTRIGRTDSLEVLLRAR